MVKNVLSQYVAYGSLKYEMHCGYHEEKGNALFVKKDGYWKRPELYRMEKLMKVLDTSCIPFDLISDFRYHDINHALSVVNGKEIKNLLTIDGVDLNIDSEEDFYMASYSIEDGKYGFYMEFRESISDKLIGYLFRGKDSIILLIYNTQAVEVTIMKKNDSGKYAIYASGTYNRILKDSVLYTLPVYQKKENKEYIYVIDRTNCIVKECRMKINGKLMHENHSSIEKKYYPNNNIHMIENKFPVLFKLASYHTSESYFLSSNESASLTEKIKIKKKVTGEIDRIENYLSIEL